MIDRGYIQNQEQRPNQGRKPSRQAMTKQQKSYAMELSNLFELSPLKVQERLDEEDEADAVDPEDLSDEMLQDDMDHADEDTPEPVDKTRNEEDFDDLLLEAYTFDPGPVVLDPANVYWLEISGCDKNPPACQCHFRVPDWLRPVAPYEDFVKTLKTFMYSLANWLQTHASAYLADPTPEHYAKAQGTNYEDFCNNSIVTQQGLLGVIKGLDEPRFSKLLPNIWLMWQSQELKVAPLKLVFSEDYQVAWVKQGLATIKSDFCKEDVNLNNCTPKDIKDAAPNQDSFDKAFTRLCGIVRLKPTFLYNSFE